MHEWQKDDQVGSERTFVGRERELSELRGGLADATSGRGRVGGMFLISGEPGIGKTRLADELASEAASRGMRVVWGRCWEGGGAPAYWPWIQVIRGCVSSADSAQRRAVLESEHASSMVETVAQIVPELHAFAPRPLRSAMTPRPDAPQTQFRLFDSVATLLKDFARSQPLLILLDDLHDADYASLMMLRLIAQGLAGAGILIVGTHRDLEVRRSPELSKHIGDLSREARCIPLTGLSQAEVAQFVELSSGQTPDDKLIARLHAATAGNPLFVDGVVRMLIADGSAGNEPPSDHQFKIPDTLREAIRRRLAVLSEEAHTLLKVAAAIGNEFGSDLCLRVGEVSQDQFNLLLDEASSGGLVLPLGQGRYRFAHALVRAAVYDALDSNTRIRLHGKIAETLEEIHAKDLRAHLAELAHHFRAAGATEKAIKFSNRAAKAARAVFAHADTAMHWREALALSEGQNDARRAEMLYGLGTVEAFFVDPAAGVRHLEAALSLYRELKSDENVARVNATLGLGLSAQSDFAPAMNVRRALDYFREAQAWKGEWSDLFGLGWLHQGLAIALFQEVRIDEAIVAVQQARATWERASNPAWVMSASVHAQFLTIKGRHREAAALFDELSRVVQDVADPEVFRSAMWYAGWCRMLMRDPIEAKRFFTIGMERPGLSPHQRERHFEFLAYTELIAGNLARAKELASEHQVNPTFRAAIALREGDWEAAIKMEESMQEWARRTGHRWNVANSLTGLFEIVRVTGDFERAADILQQVLRSYPPGLQLFETANRTGAVLLAVATERLEEANQHLEACRAIVAQGEDWLGRAGLLERAEGAVAAAQGGIFAPHFEKSVAILKRYRMPWDEAETLYQWGLALNKAGEYSEANEKFDAAIEIYRRHGAGQRWIDRVEAARPSSAAATASPKPAEASSASAIFRPEGEFWTIAHNGATVRLRDAKGLRYLAYLLARPGERIHVYDLITAVDGSAASAPSQDAARSDGLEIVRDTGGAAIALDSRARSEYGNRLRELGVELEEADRFNDTGRSERLRAEIEQVSDELRAGFGRSATSDTAERARGMIRKRIRASLEKINDLTPALGHHFAASIKTGYFCVYLPDPDRKISWQ